MAEAGTVTSTEAPILELKNVSKTFGGVIRALDNVSITVRKNEILGVVGENGAGKTTLMKILVGVHAPDAGEWEYRGMKVPFPASPKEAAQKGISIVYQEKGVIPSLKVFQFIFLGHEEQYQGKLGLDLDRMRQDARSLLEEFHVRCSVEDFMYSLPLSTQKMVEIARAVMSIRVEQGDPSATPVIILDEPTAPLTIEERKELLADVAKMKANTSFIFVTHIMQEVMEFMDRVVVLRDGKLVTEYNMTRDRVTEEELTKVIVGKETLQRATKNEFKEQELGAEIALSAKNLSRNGSYYNISFDLHRGECIGIYGPAGSGKSELIRTVAGLMNFDEGQLLLNGRDAKPHEPSHVRLANGVGYFSGDTSNELLHDWPITKNVSLLNTSKIVREFLRIIGFRLERELAERIVDKLRIRAPGIRALVSTLSGGSKQKVTVGKWFEKSPDILLVEDPTIGIDVGSREDIYQTTLEMKKRGISMLLVSDDPKEYAALCDRVVMLKQGSVQEIISNKQFREAIET